MAKHLIDIATEVVKPNKYSLGISLLRVVPSTCSLALKKFRYTFYVYVNEYTNFYIFPWHIEQYSKGVPARESHTSIRLGSPAAGCEKKGHLGQRALDHQIEYLVA